MTIEERLDQVLLLKRQIAALEQQLADHLGELTNDVAEGDLDATFCHNDASFNWSPGRISFDYPQSVVDLSLQLNRARADAIANGTAAMKRGQPYWTVRLPNS